MDAQSDNAVSNEASRRSLLMSRSTTTFRYVSSTLGHGLLLLITCLSLVTVFFIFWFIAKDAIPYLSYEVKRGDIIVSGETPAGETVRFDSLDRFREFAAAHAGTDERMKLRLYRPIRRDARVEELKGELIAHVEKGARLAAEGKLAEQGAEGDGTVQFSALRREWTRVYENLESGYLLRNQPEVGEALEALAPDTIAKQAGTVLQQVRSMTPIGEAETRIYTYMGPRRSEGPGHLAYERARLASLTPEHAASFYRTEGSVLKQYLGYPEGAQPVITVRSKLLDLRRIRQFLFGDQWRPEEDPGSFGARPIFFGSFIVTLGAIVVAVPLGVAASVCLSDILPFGVRQYVKPGIEILAAIPSVAYGFFALVVFAPVLEQFGGQFLAVLIWVIGLPLLALLVVVASDLIADKLGGARAGKAVRIVMNLLLGVAGLGVLYFAGKGAYGFDVQTGQNALNVSVILGIMALPTIVSVSEDALQAVGRELREGSYALGATRAETVVKTVIPAAVSGIIAAVILGIMRAIGETMVVWMASGNAAHIPQPWWNVFEPIRTLTATIAGDMGEADQVTGAARFHVLFLMALCLLTFSFALNLASEWVVRLQRKKLGK